MLSIIPQNQNSLLNFDRDTTIITMIGVLTIFVIFLIGYLIYKFRYLDNGTIPNDTESQDTLNNINDSMKSLLGNNWKAVLFFIICLFIVMLVLLYFISLKNISVNISSDQKLLIDFLYIFLIFLTIVIFAITVRILYDISKDKDNIPKNSKDYDNINYTGKVIVYGLIGGLSILVVFGYLIYRYVLKY